MNKTKSEQVKKTILLYFLFIAIYLVLLFSDSFLYTIFSISAPQNLKDVVFLFQEDLIFFPLIFLAGFLFILFRKNRKESKRQKKKELLVLIFAYAASLLTSIILKQIIYKPRPDTSLGFNSFPSGHATGVSAIFPFLQENSKTVKIIWIVFSCLVLLSRFVFGYHYLSDLFLGIVIGYSISLIFKLNYAK